MKSKSSGKKKLDFITKLNPVITYFTRQKFENLNKILYKFDHYMAISEFMKIRLIFSGIKKEKISVIYNIIKFEKFINLKNKKNKIKKILYLGAYTEPKGVKFLLNVLNKIDLDYEANFYGKGVLKNYLIKNANKKIKINDYVDNNKVPEIVGDHDVIIFPSFVGEAFGRSALEGICANKIVIATNIGGVTDIIIDSKTGFLFDIGDSKELKKLIESAILNKLVINNVELSNHITKNFKKEKILKKLINTYNHILRLN